MALKKQSSRCLAPVRRGNGETLIWLWRPLTWHLFPKETNSLHFKNTVSLTDLRTGYLYISFFFFLWFHFFFFVFESTHFSVQQRRRDSSDDVAVFRVDVEHSGGRVGRRLPDDIVAKRGVIGAWVVSVKGPDRHHRGS